MLREKECHLKPRIYKVDFLLFYNNGTIEEKSEYYEGESTSDVQHKWLDMYNLCSFVKFVRCTEVFIQWN
ncbi:hypothetical protein EFN13_17 [Enterococcus phage N13]|nr:hypothetical protein EFN13_17 [Enterococcus phage N13]